MKRFYSGALALLMITSAADLSAQTKPATDLPNISLIGNMLGRVSESEKRFDVQEIELSFQHYLYPSVKSDAFIAFHKDGDERVVELEEAYVTFLNPVGLLFPNYTRSFGLGGIVGKKLVSFGKVNPLHPEQQHFVDRSAATQQFIGGEEGLNGEGAQVSWLLPLPFFSQLEAGYWTVAAHDHAEEEEDAEEHSGVEYENRVANARLWNSFALSQNGELELGLNYLLGNTSADSTDEKQDVLGVDLTFTKSFATYQKLILQSEYYSATYGHEGEERATQSGGFFSTIYRLNKAYSLGARYDFIGKHGDEGENVSHVSLMATRQLTETSKFRIQYTTGDSVENTVLAQFIFGMGPHAHVLQ